VDELEDLFPRPLFWKNLRDLERRGSRAAVFRVDMETQEMPDARRRKAYEGDWERRRRVTPGGSGFIIRQSDFDRSTFQCWELRLIAERKPWLCRLRAFVAISILEKRGGCSRPGSLSAPAGAGEKGLVQLFNGRI
jgi:hypothetical protein